MTAPLSSLSRSALIAALEASRKALTAKMFAADAGVTCEHEGRHYITAGRPGFNSPANNRDGYATEAAARAASAGYVRRAMIADRRRRTGR
jgi:hypothetical protein